MICSEINGKKKLFCLVILLLSSSLLMAFQSSQFRLVSSLNTLGHVYYNDFDGSASSEFTTGYSFGIEAENSKYETKHQGAGILFFVKTKVKNRYSNWSDYMKKSDFDENISIYYFRKFYFNNNEKGNSYIKLNCGTGAPYYLYGAIGFGFNINKHINFDILYNYHYAFAFLVNKSINYLSINLGYVFINNSK